MKIRTDKCIMRGLPKKDSPWLSDLKAQRQKESMWPEDGVSFLSSPIFALRAHGREK